MQLVQLRNIMKVELNLIKLKEDLEIWLNLLKMLDLEKI